MKVVIFSTYFVTFNIFPDIYIIVFYKTLSYLSVLYKDILRNLVIFGLFSIPIEYLAIYIIDKLHLTIFNLFILYESIVFTLK